MLLIKVRKWDAGNTVVVHRPTDCRCRCILSCTARCTDSRPGILRPLKFRLLACASEGHPGACIRGFRCDVGRHAEIMLSPEPQSTFSPLLQEALLYHAFSHHASALAREIYKDPRRYAFLDHRTIGTLNSNIKNTLRHVRHQHHRNPRLRFQQVTERTRRMGGQASSRCHGHARECRWNIYPAKLDQG